MNDIEIYTDGSCIRNPGPGGWGAYIVYDANNHNMNQKLYGSNISTTNNRMELYAAIQAISYIDSRSNIKLYTDSIYVQKGMTTWIKSWQKSGRLDADNKALVLNADLWLMLLQLSNKHNIEWLWVKGHSNVAGNIIADELANIGSRQALSKLIEEK